MRTVDSEKLINGTLLFIRNAGFTDFIDRPVLGWKIDRAVAVSLQEDFGGRP